MNSAIFRVVLVALLLTAAARSEASSTVIYDSAGFEPPRFSHGLLTGQDGGIWTEAGGANGGTAGVVTNTFSGTQALQVTRTTSSQNGGDKYYWPITTPVVPAGAQHYITVNWDMKVTSNSTAGVITGPFFGIEAEDGNDNLIAAAGVDATTGEVLFGDPKFKGGFNSTTGDATVPLNQWNHFMLAMDFSTDTADVFVNGSLAQVVNGFDTSGITRFSDADIAALATAVEPTNQTDSAFFDNYVVTQTDSIPEPVLLAPVMLGALQLRRRRREATA